MTNIRLDAETFNKRSNALYSAWAHDLSDLDMIVVVVGVPSELTAYQKSTALHFWLFGYEFPETIIAIERANMSILTSSKKKSVLESLGCLENPPTIRVRNKTNHSQTIAEFFQATGAGARIGMLTKDRAEGEFAENLNAFVSKHRFEVIDVSSFVASLLVIKDEQELGYLRLASASSGIVMKEFVFESLKTIIDKKKRISHEKFAESIEDLVSGLGDGTRTRPRLPETVQTEYVDMCYPPIIQSGGIYSLKPSEVSDNRSLKFDTIVCSLGIRYRSYCSNIGRTFLVEPTDKQKEDYRFAVELMEHLLEIVRPGTQFAGIHQQATEHVKTRRSELLPFLLNNFGFSIGLEFRESDYIINGKNERAVESGMVINLVVGFQNVKEEDRMYSILVADTVSVQKQETVKLTGEFVDLEQIVCACGSQESESSESEPDIRARLRPDRATGVIEDREMEKTQKELCRAVIKEALARHSKDHETIEAEEPELDLGIESYRRDVFLPREIRDLRIFVDKRNESVLFPIYGLSVPFHVSLIKNVSKSEEGEDVYLRVNFNPLVRSRELGFIKAFTFKSSQALHMNTVYRDIMDLKKTMAIKEQERKELADLVEQEDLEENKSAAKTLVRLSEVHMKPVLDGRRTLGDVEIHKNGIRFKSMVKSDLRCDILFGNMKHVFFQPSEDEMVAILHIRLRHPIMVAKKKTQDVQFYREALEAMVEETGGRRRTVYGDEDEILQEQEERNQRIALDNEFKTFCEKLTRASDVHVDIPIRELGFYGVPFRQNVMISPTRDCLVNVQDAPYLIVPFDDIEVVSLERVLFGLKNFDMVVVFKDHSIKPQHIDTISMENLNAIKDLLNTSRVYFITSNVNLNWSNVMKTVRSDPVGFYEMGGWEMIRADPVESESDEAGDLPFEDESEKSEESYEEEEFTEEEELTEESEPESEPDESDESI